KVEGELLQSWIINEIDACPLWSSFFRVRRHPNLPCFVTLAHVSERLRGGLYYRQLEAIEDDLHKVVECATFMKPEHHPFLVKAQRFAKELEEIIAFAKLGDIDEP